jgi:hypothetical protein
MYYSLLICLLEVYFERKVCTCLKVKEKVMKVETTNIASIEEILASYSGRRLQYAIKLGILPTPESLCQLLKRKTSVEKYMTHTGNRGLAKFSTSPVH